MSGCKYYFYSCCMAHSFEKTQNGPLTDTAELYCAAVFHFMAPLAGGVTLLSLFIYFNNRPAHSSWASHAMSCRTANNCLLTLYNEAETKGWTSGQMLDSCYCLEFTIMLFQCSRIVSATHCCVSLCVCTCLTIFRGSKS